VTGYTSEQNAKAKQHFITLPGGSGVQGSTFENTCMPSPPHQAQQLFTDQSCSGFPKHCERKLYLSGPPPVIVSVQRSIANTCLDLG
jgi:hypothetical protein